MLPRDGYVTDITIARAVAHAALWTAVREPRHSESTRQTVYFPACLGAL